MTNDGWGKPTGWGKPAGWTTQQAVDKAVEMLNTDKQLVKELTETQPSEVELNLVKHVKEKAKADITNPNEGWGKPIQSNLPKIDVRDFGIKDIAISASIVVDKELEFLLAREVKLNLNSKLFAIDAVQVGDLAIWDDGDFFAISHVPTLARFMNAVPTEDDKAYEHDSLVLWCTKVQRSHHEEWKTLRALTPQNHSTKNTKAAEAALRLREWCLSVPIE